MRVWERMRVHGYLCGDAGLRAWARASEPMVCVDAGLRAVSPSVGLTGSLSSSSVEISQGGKLGRG